MEFMLSWRIIARWGQSQLHALARQLRCACGAPPDRPGIDIKRISQFLYACFGSSAGGR
jgi:hypothetical protein